MEEKEEGKKNEANEERKLREEGKGSANSE